jgi:hypothetical protein
MGPFLVSWLKYCFTFARGQGRGKALPPKDVQAAAEDVCPEVIAGRRKRPSGIHPGPQHPSLTSASQNQSHDSTHGSAPARSLCFNSSIPCG